MRGRSKSKAGPKWGGTNNDSGFEDFGLVRIYSGFQGLGGGVGGSSEVLPCWYSPSMWLSQVISRSLIDPLKEP